MSVSCPSHAELKSALEADSSTGSYVDEHLNECKLCQSIVEGLWEHRELRSRCLTYYNNQSSTEDMAIDPDRIDRIQKLIESALTDSVSTGRESLHWRQHDYSVSHSPPAERAISFGPYEIETVLGSGGTATVYFGRHQALARPTAVKVIQSRRPDIIQRFRTEVGTVARLDHPYIATAYDAGSINDVAYLAMEFVDGWNVAEVLDRNKLPLPVACEIARQTALGLDYAHEQGFLHRDIKPSNLMLSRDGIIKIVDFGLARVLESDVRDTRSSMFLGTLAFASPDQVFNPSAVTDRADVYSLGCTLFYCILGKTPFEAQFANREQEPHPLDALDTPGLRLSSFEEDIPAEVDELVAEMMAANPTQRPTAAEVAERLARLGNAQALAKFVTQLPDPGRRDPCTQFDQRLLETSPRRKVSRRAIVGGTVAAGGIAVIGYFSGAFSGRSNQGNTKNTGGFAATRLSSVRINAPTNSTLSWHKLNNGQTTNDEPYKSKTGQDVQLIPGEYLIEWQHQGDTYYAMRFIPNQNQRGGDELRWWQRFQRIETRQGPIFELNDLQLPKVQRPALQFDERLGMSVSQLVTIKEFSEKKMRPFSFSAGMKQAVKFNPGVFAAVTYGEAVTFAEYVGCRLLSLQELSQISQPPTSTGLRW